MFPPQVPAPLDAPAPSLQRGGTVVPRQRRLRRSSANMKADPCRGRAEAIEMGSFDNDSSREIVSCSLSKFG